MLQPSRNDRWWKRIFHPPNVPHRSPPSRSIQWQLKGFGGNYTHRRIFAFFLFLASVLIFWNKGFQTEPFRFVCFAAIAVPVLSSDNLALRLAIAAIPTLAPLFVAVLAAFWRSDFDSKSLIGVDAWLYAISLMWTGIACFIQLVIFFIQAALESKKDK